jgi:hypothetical protein
VIRGRPDWHLQGPAAFTGGVAASANRFDKQDVKILALASGAVILAGLVVAAVILIGTGREGSQKKVGPFPAGLASAVRSDLKDGGPYFFPDPFGGNKNMLLALENGKIVALASLLPDTKTCEVKWKGSQNAFVDCHGDKLKSTELARYASSVGQSGNLKGILLIDPRQLLPPPNPA